MRFHGHRGVPSRAHVSRRSRSARLVAETLERRLCLTGLDPGQAALPTKVGQTFVLSDFNDVVTRTDLGLNNFGGNQGALNDPKPVSPDMAITTLNLATESAGPTGGSLSFAYDFAKTSPLGNFSGFFASTFGLTDTKVTLTPGAPEPAETTSFPGYFLDTRDFYRGLATMAGRSLETLRFDAKLTTGQPITLKVEFKDVNGHDVYARRTLSGDTWQAQSLAMPADFAGSLSGGAFDWRRVRTVAFIVERENIADHLANPISGSFLLDNIAFQDLDGRYPDLAAAATPADGQLNPRYRQAFLDLVRSTSFQYYLDFASTDPRTGGLIQDRSTFADLLTVGGGGDQLTAYAIGAREGYLSRVDAATRTYDLLKAMYDAPQGPRTAGIAGHEGFYYHFLGIDGRRKQNFNATATLENEALNTVELSPIDTALFVAGAITSRQFFDGPGKVESDIRDIADAIYARVNWKFMINANGQFYLGWKPNEPRDDTSGRYGRFLLNDDAGTGQYSSKPGPNGELPATIDYETDEGLLLALLAINAPNPAFRADLSAWTSMVRDRQGGAFVRTYPGSLFTYQFFSQWLDTKALGTDITGVDDFDNTREATLATIAYATANPRHEATLGPNRWGLSATEGPFDSYFAEAAPTAAIHPMGNEPMGEAIGAGPLAFEAEAGTGDGVTMSRGHASAGSTVLLFAGQTRTIAFDTTGVGRYHFTVPYSNDGLGDTITVTLDGTPIGQFNTIDTRPAGGGGGSGWDNFLVGDTGGPAIVRPGHHVLTLMVTAADPFGVEVDRVDLTPVPVPRPLELGVVTNYAVGSAIVHLPDQALAALWHAATLNLHGPGGTSLLDPRFGFADAFTLDVSDAIVPGAVDAAETRVLRASGPWADRIGFAIDHGPMMVMIDNAMSKQSVPKLFMSYPAIASALDRLFPQRVRPAPDFSNVSARGIIGSTTTYTATLSYAGLPWAGRSVEFSIVAGPVHKVVGTTTTNAAGVATLNLATLSGLTSGTYVNGLVARFAGDATRAGATASGVFTVLPVPLVRVDGVRYTTNKKGLVTQVFIHFTGDVNAVQASLLGTYRLATAGRGGSFDAPNARTIALRSARYLALGRTLTLTPLAPFTLVQTVQARVKGLAPQGLRDRLGHLIDGDHDGKADPQNVFDSTLAAARYLCSGGLNLRNQSQVLTAILRYNNSMAYAQNVLGWAAAYATGVQPVDLPAITGPVPAIGDAHLEAHLDPQQGLGPGIPLNAIGLPSTDPLINLGNSELAGQLATGPLPGPTSALYPCEVICLGAQAPLPATTEPANTGMFPGMPWAPAPAPESGPGEPANTFPGMPWAPAPAAPAMVRSVIPPSTSSSIGRPLVSIIARSSATLASTAGM